MPKGIEVEAENGFATVTFTDRTLAGPALSKLLAIGGPELVDVDTSGTRRSYRVPESIAADAGLIDEPVTPKKTPRKAAAKKVAEPKAQPNASAPTKDSSGTKEDPNPSPGR